VRLPFLQFESDFLAHGAAELANLARCSPAQAIGHVALLRAWSVSHANDEAPPDGLVLGDAAGRRIEAAAQWQGERGALLEALLDAGQVERTDGGFRVLHLNPYAKAWEQNRKAKERMRNARERSANMRVTDHERSAKFTGQTQTQTQTQKEASASQAEAVAPPALSHDVAHDDGLPDATADAEPIPAEQPAGGHDIPQADEHPEREVLELKPQVAGKKPRSKRAEFELYERLEASRARCCEDKGLVFVPSRWDGGRIPKALGGVVKGTDEERDIFEAGWNAYCEDPIALTREPAFSLEWFMKYRSRYEGRALKSAGGGA
jgi:hypothetical protein